MSTFMKYLAIGVFSLILAACATNYVAEGWDREYSNTQLADNVFEVRYSGNAPIPMEQAMNFLLLYAAELCLEHGYHWVVLSS